MLNQYYDDTIERDAPFDTFGFDFATTASATVVDEPFEMTSLFDYGMSTGLAGFESLFGAEPDSLSDFGTLSSASPLSSTVTPKEEPRLPAPTGASVAKPKSKSDPVARKRERNRLAAERCRQRKTDLISTLQKECDDLRIERERLLAENARLMAVLGLRL